MQWKGRNIHTASVKFPLKPSCWRLIISSCCLLISSSRRLRSSSCLQRSGKDAQHNSDHLHQSVVVLPTGLLFWKPTTRKALFCWGCEISGTSWWKQTSTSRTFSTLNFKEFIIELSLGTPTYTAALKYMLTTLHCVECIEARQFSSPSYYRSNLKIFLEFFTMTLRQGRVGRGREISETKLPLKGEDRC